MKVIYYILLFSFSGFSQTQNPTPTSTDQQILQQVLKNYHLKTIQFKIEQEIFLSAIKTKMKSQGILSIKGKKFLLKLKGKPSSVMIFDGKFLWYQADINEKVVFQLKKPSQIQILTSFFNEKSLLESFHIKEAKKINQDYIFRLTPKKKIEGLSEVFMKAHFHISEIRLIWDDLNNWQKYKCSKPVSKQLPDRLFQFPTAGFQVITKN